MALGFHYLYPKCDFCGTLFERDLSKKIVAVREQFLQGFLLKRIHLLIEFNDVVNGNTKCCTNQLTSDA